VVYFDFNFIFTAGHAKNAESSVFSFTGKRLRQVRIKAPVIEKSQALRTVLNIKLTIRMVPKDAMNKILPKGLLFFTFWRLSKKRKGESTLRSLRARAQRAV
jgi:hypothetical protein